MSLSLAIWIAVATTVLNGFFAGVETGFTSARRISLAHRARRGNRLAAWASRLARRREDVITSAVVGNNVSVVVGTSVLTAAFVAWLGDLGETLAAVLMTVVTIVFGEILPKAIYRAQPERMVVWSAVPFTVLALILAPLSWLARLVARAMLSLLGGNAEERNPDISRDTLVSAFHLSHRHDELNDREGQLVNRFVRNCNLPVEAVMTPSDSVAALSRGATVADAIDLVRSSGRSRLPVLDAEFNYVGLILFRDLLHADPTETIDTYERTLLFLPRQVGLDEAIALLRGHRGNMAAVVDDADQSVGVLTLEDLLEPLVGDILDEHDRPGMTVFS